MFTELYAQETQQTTTTQTTPQGAPAKPAPTIMTYFPFILIMVIIWFFMIRPQSKKQKETAKMLEALKAKDKVETIGGIFGEVDSVKDENTVILKIGKDTKIEIRKSAVSRVVVNK